MIDLFLQGGVLFMTIITIFLVMVGVSFYTHSDKVNIWQSRIIFGYIRFIYWTLFCVYDYSRSWKCFSCYTCWWLKSCLNMYSLWAFSLSDIKSTLFIQIIILMIYIISAFFFSILLLSPEDNYLEYLFNGKNLVGFVI